MGHGPLTAVALAIAYLIGSIPFSYLVARRKGIDVRTVGSGNVGATNVMRSAGRAAGLAAFALDFLKGSLATWLALRLAGPTIAAVAAVIAVLGHMYPAWLSFKGGKGVATGAGAFLPILPVAAVIGLLTFGVVAWLTRYASAGSIAGTSALPVVAWLMRAPAASTIAAAIAAALIVWKHRENIRRIAAGSERRMGARKEGTP